MRERFSHPTAPKLIVAGLLTAAALLAHPASLRPQDGTTASTVGGAALGLYSGAVMGLAGSGVPCAQVAWTLTCSRLASLTGGLVGGIAGGLLGDAEARRVEAAFRHSGFGALAGATAGIVAQQLIYYYGWKDALAFAALGAAIGPVAPAAAIGLAAGGVIGVALWYIIPSFELTDAAALGGVGLAVGGLTAWAAKAADARDDADAAPLFTINIVSFRF